ncbi:unnamed protein product [Adineta ricciae]|nr:unnamed protein product [Adineta ricciae]
MTKLIFPSGPDEDESSNEKTQDRKAFSNALKRLPLLKIPTDNNFQEHELLLASISDYGNKYFQSPEYSQLIQSMILQITNYSNQTILVPCLIKPDYPSSVLNWINRLPNEQSSPSYKHLIGIIYNISRHDEGVQILNALDATNKLKEFQKDHRIAEIDIICAMTMALLSTPEQIKNERKRMNNILDQLLEIVNDASKRPPTYMSDGWHISEPSIVLVRLICYERTLDYILQHAQVEFDADSIVKFFIELFLNFHKQVQQNDPLKLSTLTALCNILWSISLRQQYKDELKENLQLKSLLEEFIHQKTLIDPTHYVPKYMENIQKAAEGILCNINTNEINLSNQQQISTLTKDKKPSIMISYAHSDNSICSQIYNELDKYNRQFDIWIDWKNSKTGYLWGKIADGMADANIILCLLSSKYYESKSCQQEFVYAHDHLKKIIIPIFILDDKPPGWIAIHTCIMKYVRFRNVKQLEQEKFKELIEMIKENLFGINLTKDEQSLTLPVHHDIPVISEKDAHELLVDLSKKPVNQWTKSDIKQWFQENQIPIDLWKLYQFENGSHMLNYAKSLTNDDKIESQREIYSNEFSEVCKGKRLLPHQFTTFAFLLRKLYLEQITSEPTKSQTCQIS